MLDMNQFEYTHNTLNVWGESEKKVLKSTVVILNQLTRILHVNTIISQFLKEDFLDWMHDVHWPTDRGKDQKQLH